MVTRVPGYTCPPYHAVAQTLKEGKIVYRNPGTQISVSAQSAAAQTLKGGQIVYGNRAPGYPCLPCARVPGYSYASTAPHQVGYPVPNFEAGVQL